MSKKITLFFVGLAFLFSCRFAHAGLIINEIMYDLEGADDGREWVEIYNDADIPVDLSTFKFFEADVNHKLILFEGDKNISARGYAIIVSNPMKFKTDWPSFSGNIFDSSFSLSNSGEALALKDKDLVVDQHVYKSSPDSAGDGKSLQKINGAWEGATLTLGKENKKSPPKISVAQNKNLTKITTPPSAPLLNQGGDEDGNFYFFIITLFFIFSFGGGAVYFIRQKKTVSRVGDDFKILDE